MCTVTIIPLIDVTDRRIGARLACNRDELRTRPAALPPVFRRCGEHQAIFPIDPLSDGTWIGINDAGVGATLLNVNTEIGGGIVADIRFRGASPGSNASDRLSRGIIIPKMLERATAAEAAAVAANLDPARFPSFRVVVLDDRDVIELRSDGRSMRRTQYVLKDGPLFFTSSGLGDDLVEGPRRELFERMFAGTSDLASVQSAFHRHVWTDRMHLSVCMSRPDARTVSHTVVDAVTDRVTLCYLPHEPNRPGETATLSMARKVSNPCHC